MYLVRGTVPQMYSCSLQMWATISWVDLSKKRINSPSPPQISETTVHLSRFISWAQCKDATDRTRNTTPWTELLTCASQTPSQSNFWYILKGLGKSHWAKTNCDRCRDPIRFFSPYPFHDTLSQNLFQRVTIPYALPSTLLSTPEKSLQKQNRTQSHTKWGLV